MAHKLFHVGVKALMVNPEGKVLLCKTPPWKDLPAYWDLPGGRIEDNQTAEEALRRELEEETGLTDVGAVTFFSGFISKIEIPVSDAQSVGLALMVYALKLTEDKSIKLSDEHTDYEWVSLAEAAERLKVKYPQEFTDALVS